MKNRKLILWWVICSLMCIVTGCDQEDDPVEEVAPAEEVYSRDSYCMRWYYRYKGKGEYARGYTVFDQSLTNSFYEKNGKTYQMVRIDADTKEPCPFPIEKLIPKEVLGIREKGGRVYVDRQEYMTLLETSNWNIIGDKTYIPYKTTAEGELVIYDYNMQVGDKYPHIEGHEDISVVNKETMTTPDGVKRRLLTLSNGCKILEGIGCLNSPGLYFFYLNPVLGDYNDKAWLNGCRITKYNSRDKIIGLYQGSLDDAVDWE